MKARLVSVALWAIVSAGPARAADELIPADYLKVLLSVSRVDFLSNDAAPYAVPPGGGAADPTLVGGSLRVWDVGNPANQEIYALPAGGWKAVGSGYRYTGNDPCKVDVRTQEIDVSCDAVTTLTTPFSGDGGVTLTLGAGAQRYCAVLGGDLVQNAPDVFKRVHAPAPAVCEPTTAPFDEPLAGRVAVVRPDRVARLVSRPGVTTLPEAAGAAPVVDGATLRIFDTGGGAGDVTYALPSTRWSTARLGYKYRGPVGDPCRLVLITPTVLKAICRREAVTLTPPFTGDAAFVLTAGGSARYCAQFGGDEVRNDAIMLKRTNAAAPVACASPGGAFLEIGMDLWE